MLHPLSFPGPCVVPHFVSVVDKGLSLCLLRSFTGFTYEKFNEFHANPRINTRKIRYCVSMEFLRPLRKFTDRSLRHYCSLRYLGYLGNFFLSVNTTLYVSNVLFMCNLGFDQFT